MPIRNAQNYGNNCTKVTLADGTVLIVPQDSLNMDYVHLQAWVAAGGTIT